MKLTYEKLGGIMPALAKLSKLDLKASEAVRLARLLCQAETELQFFEDARIALFKKYGELNGDSYEIVTENKGEFLKEYRELCNTEIKLDTEKIEIKSDISIDASSVLALENLVEFAEA